MNSVVPHSSKRKAVPCFFCQKYNLLCDGGRPCGQCILSGKDTKGICFDSQILHQTQNRRRVSFSPAIASPSVVSLSSALHPSSTAATTNIPSVSAPSVPSGASSATRQPTITVPPRKPFFPTTTPETRDRMMNDINVFLMNELRQVKRTIEELREETANLRKENEELDKKLKAIEKKNSSSSRNSLSLHLSSFLRSKSISPSSSSLLPPNLSSVLFPPSASTQANNPTTPTPTTAKSTSSPSISTSTISSNTPPSASAPAPPTSSASSVSTTVAIGPGLINNRLAEKPVVIFDLTKRPATVLTANEEFCSLLGYSMTEVIGAPWQKFVSPSYLKQALTIFGSINSQSNVLQFEMVYLHRQGSILIHSMDTHSLFGGPDGSRLYDFITLSPIASEFPQDTSSSAPSSISSTSTSTSTSIPAPLPVTSSTASSSSTPIPTTTSGLSTLDVKEEVEEDSLQTSQHLLDMDVLNYLSNQLAQKGTNLSTTSSTTSSVLSSPSLPSSLMEETGKNLITLLGEEEVGTNAFSPSIKPSYITLPPSSFSLPPSHSHHQPTATNLTLVPSSGHSFSTNFLSSYQPPLTSSSLTSALAPHTSSSPSSPFAPGSPFLASLETNGIGSPSPFETDLFFNSFTDAEDQLHAVEEEQPVDNLDVHTNVDSLERLSQSSTTPSSSSSSSTL